MKTLISRPPLAAKLKVSITFGHQQRGPTPFLPCLAAGAAPSRQKGSSPSRWLLPFATAAAFLSLFLEVLLVLIILVDHLCLDQNKLHLEDCPNHLYHSPFSC